MKHILALQTFSRLWHRLVCGCHREDQAHTWRGWTRLIFPLMSALALAWFLCRVIPKPVRATYPCQQAAFPLASALVVWLLGMKSGLLAWLNLGERFRRFRPALHLAGLIGLLALAAAAANEVAGYLGLLPANSSGLTTDGPNSPMGTAKGLRPGRVVWAFDPAAVSWNSSGNWWDDAYNNQTNIDRMLSKTIRCIGEQDTDSAAWDAIFRSFNQRLGRGSVGYTVGQKVAVKINMNNTSSHANNNNINASPHAVLALLRQLVNQAGVPQSNITVFDASRFVTDNVFNKGHGEFPNVVFLDNSGNDGRAKSAYRTNGIPFSINHNLAKGLATCAMDAHYLINMALLKGHTGQGVTFCGKNYYGATSINSDWTKNSHDYFNQPRNGAAAYMAFADFMGHQDLGGKTMLFIMDGLYGCKTVGGTPQPKWQTAPFNNRWPSSLFVSEDGVALDSVALDFFRTEFPTVTDIDYADTYLHESATANAPASGTFYDPERDGTRLGSLGAHEHWNNATNQQYSRNLSPTGTGIELVAVHATPGLSVTIANPVNGAQLDPSTPCVISAAVSNTYSTLRAIEYRASGTLLGVASNSPYSLTWSNAPAGVWKLQAIATDTDSLRATSAVATVTVRGSNDIPPVMLAQPVSQQALLGGAAGFSVEAAGWPVPTFQWCKDGAPLAGAAGASLALSNVTAGNIGTYWAVANNAAGSVTSSLATLSVALPPTNIALIPAGSRWKYYDQMTDLGTAWRAPAYNDSSWSNGLARLGYGGDGEVTQVTSNRARITTYFRLAFTVADTNGLGALNLRMQRDDGAVAYLNGAEVWRENLSNGVVAWSTVASNAVSGSDETAWFSKSTGTALVVPGTNVFAVELHQNGTNSSDLGFNFEAIAAYPARPLPAPVPCLGVQCNDYSSGLQIHYFGQPGQQYRILGSTNLTIWIPVQTNIGAGTTMHFARPDFTGPRAYFYRLASP